MAGDTVVGEEGGGWVPGGAAGRWEEGEPLGTRRGPPGPGGSRTSVGGCCRDCRMGEGARMDLGKPRREGVGVTQRARGVLLTRPGKRSLQLPSQETLSPLSRYPGRQEHR